VVLMQSGGEALVRRAEGRASRAVEALAAAAPRVAHVVQGDALADMAVESVTAGMLILVRPGELIPCDGTVVDGLAPVDQSRITGESLPIPAGPGSALLSGGIVLDSPLTIRADRAAAESEYARIVQLVRSAQASKAPFQRIADRYAIWFTPLALAVALVAWAASHDPTRLLAVLVVATPCPMILATPVAMIGGIDRGARRGLIFRHGGALEAIAGVTMVVMDKTGTLTLGRPEVAAVTAVPPFTAERVLALAAAVERGSGHELARSVAAEAAARQLPVPAAGQMVEAPGQGVSGMVEGHRVAVGAWSYLAGGGGEPPAGAGLRAFVSIDGAAAGTIEFADRPRPEAADALAQLRALGIQRIMLLSGDHDAEAQSVAAGLGITDARGDNLPGDKLAVIRELVRDGHQVAMVGDGINDAPALSAATVGVALASGSGRIAAEAADIVLLGDDLRGVPTAVAIGRRTMRIARQSLWAGVGLSGIAMLVAAAGGIPPAIGALLQEGIDVAVILNALRTSLERGP
jgi:heavy metal translocating P-type ATPase